jgi:hypothetical protein
VRKKDEVACTATAAATISKITLSKSRFPWLIALSITNLLDPGSTSPERRFTRIKIIPKKTSLRLGQIIVLNAYRTVVRVGFLDFFAISLVSPLRVLT